MKDSEKMQAYNFFNKKAKEFIEKTIEEYIEVFGENNKKDERWVPEIGNEYYCVFSDGSVDSQYWYNSLEDLFRLGQGNVFKTEKEAKKHAKKLEAISEIINYCWAKGISKEWEAYGKDNWYIYWDADNEIFDCDFNVNWKIPSILPYLKTEKDCRKLIKEKEKELKIISELIINNK